MAFQNFIDIPVREVDLILRLAKVLQMEFKLHQNKIYFLKLEKVSEDLSRVARVLPFPNGPMEFHQWITQFIKTRLAIVFTGDHYKIFCAGFSTSFVVEAFADDLKTVYTAYENETAQGPEYDGPVTFEAGFADLRDYFKTLKKLGAV